MTSERAHLCGNVCVLLSVAITVVSIDIVLSWHPIDRLENNPGVVVRNDVGVTVLWLVHIHGGVVPCELLTYDGTDYVLSQVSIRVNR